MVTNGGIIECSISSYIGDGKMPSRGWAGYGLLPKDYKIGIKPNNTYSEIIDVCEPYGGPFPEGECYLKLSYRSPTDIQDITQCELEFTDLHFTITTDEESKHAAELYWYIKTNFRVNSNFEKVNAAFDEL